MAMSSQHAEDELRVKQHRRQCANDTRKTTCRWDGTGCVLAMRPQHMKNDFRVGAAWGTGGSCGSCAQSFFGAHDLRRGLQKTMPKTGGPSGATDLRLPRRSRTNLPYPVPLPEFEAPRLRQETETGTPLYRCALARCLNQRQATWSGMRVLRLRGSREHFLTGGRSPVVGKCYRHEALLTTTQVVGNKTSLSVEQQSHTGPRRVPQRRRA